MRNRATIFTMAILAAAGAQAWAQTVTVSDYAFTAGTAISASAMSTKLQALATAINYQANTTDATQTSLISGLRTEVDNLNTLVGTNNVGTLQSDVNSLKTEKLNSAKWSYTSSVLSYTGGNLLVTAGNVGIGTTTPTHLLDVSQSSTTPTVCIANLNGKNKGDGGITDPNIALKILGGNTSGTGGTLIEFDQPDGNRSGYIAQNGYGRISIGDNSDRRLKEGIVDTRYSLDQLMRIQVRDFVFKNDPAKQLQTGFIAQELYDVYPDAVYKPASEEGTWGVDYGKLSPIIVKSIQDQQKEIVELKAENAELKARIAAIEKKLGM
jgi:hypothetical protein